MKNWPQTIAEYISRSTLKREIASVMLFWWMGQGSVLLNRVPVTQIQADAAIVAWGSAGTLIIGFVTIAFSQDWISKQTTIAGPPMNTEITTTTEVNEGMATTSTTSEQKI